MATTRIRLGELLVRAGVIDDMQLKAALAEQHRWGGRLGKILVDMAFVSEDIIVKALSKQLGVPRADLSTIDVPENIMRQVSPDFADSHGLVPLHLDTSRRVLTVATSDPTNVAAFDELRFKTGLRIETALAGEIEIHHAINRYLRPSSAFGIDLPEAIELDDDDGRPVIVPNEAYNKAMAASGMPMLSHRAGGGVPAPVPPAPPVSAPPSPPAGLPPMPPVPSSGPSMAMGMGSVPRPSLSPPPMATLARDAGGYPIPSATLRPSAIPVPSAVPSAAPAMPPAAEGSALDMAQRLEGAQRQQLKALRVMVELLIEKGVISRDEYLARVGHKQ